MSIIDESIGNINESNISMMETKASFTEKYDVNLLLEEYDSINQNCTDTGKELIEKLSTILDKFKTLDANNNLIEDIIVEIENKILLGKQVLENPTDLEKLEKLKEASTFHKNNWNYSTYNRIIDEKEEDDGIPKMSKKFFNKLLCSNFRLYYRTHELNDILYLHFKGFKKIENLQSFANLKVLYLEGNSIKKIDGLNHLKSLTSLYLHENCIEKIENLDGLDNLYNLNLSDNCISKIENLSNLKTLSNLLLKRNRIGIDNEEDLLGLADLPASLTVLDISDNRIEITSFVKDLLTKISNLRVLYLQGNECVRKIQYYRKNLIITLQNLHYLDDKPVFEEERRFAEAFGRGGLDEEKKERVLYKKEKEEYEIKRLKDFSDLIDGWKKEKIQGEDFTNETVAEEKKKKRDEDKKKLLLKCKEKSLIAKEQKIKVDSEICENSGNMLIIKEEKINEEEFDLKNQTKPNDITEKKEMIKPSNDIFEDYEDDLPNLETIKFKKNSEYIDYILEKNQYNDENEIEEKKEKKKEEKFVYGLNEKDEVVDTTFEKVDLIDIDLKEEKKLNVEVNTQSISTNNFEELD